MKSETIYLDTYVLQKDMRIRMPKAILSNLNAQKGETTFDIYFNPSSKEIILRKHEDDRDDE